MGLLYIILLVLVLLLTRLTIRPDCRQVASDRVAA